MILREAHPKQPEGKTAGWFYSIPMIDIMLQLISKQLFQWYWTVSFTILLFQLVFVAAPIVGFHNVPVAEVDLRHQTKWYCSGIDHSDKIDGRRFLYGPFWRSVLISWHLFGCVCFIAHGICTFSACVALSGVLVFVSRLPFGIFCYGLLPFALSQRCLFGSTVYTEHRSQRSLIRGLHILSPKGIFWVGVSESD